MPTPRSATAGARKPGPRTPSAPSTRSTPSRTPRTARRAATNRTVAALLSAAALLAVSAAAAHGMGLPRPVQPSGPVGSAGPVGQYSPSARLTVTYDDGSSHPRSYTVTCGDGRIFTRDANACRHLDEIGGPVSAVPEGQACSMIYGGPQTAELSGTWQGQPVTESYRRTNGCEVARWNRMVPALPNPVGTETHGPLTG